MGRKRLDESEKRQPVHVKLDPLVCKYLNEQESKTRLIEDLILRSQSFKAWLREQKEKQ